MNSADDQRRKQLLDLAECADPDIRQPAIQDLWLEFGVDVSRKPDRPPSPGQLETIIGKERAKCAPDRAREFPRLQPKPKTNIK